MNRRVTATLLGGVLMAGFFFSAAVLAEERTPLPPGMERYFAGIRTEGDLDGRLICVGEDLIRQKLPGCLRGEHDGLLVMEGDLIAHLIGRTLEMQQQIKSDRLHGKEVTVSGTYAEPWNTILVRAIHERARAAEDSTP